MENETQTAETQPDTPVQADEPKKELASKVIAGFTVIRRSEVDPMTPFRLVAEGLEVEEGLDNLDKTNAGRLARAINEKWSVGSARIEKAGDGTFRVYRVTTRAPRKPSAKKAGTTTEGSTEKKATTKKGGK